MAHGIRLKDESTGAIISALRNDNSEARTYTLPDVSGTVSLEEVTQVAVTGAITLDATALGKLHSCSGTAANYTVTLPTAVDNTGKSIGIVGASGLTRFVTIDGNGSETLGGSANIVIWANEVLVLVSDGSNWIVSHRYFRQLTCELYKNSANQLAVTTATLTKVTLPASRLDNSGRMADTTNSRINIVRTGYYRVTPFLIMGNLTANASRVIAQVYKNGSTADSLSPESSVLSGGYGSSTGNLLMSLTAGDYLELYGFHNAGSNQAFFGAASGTVCGLTVQEVIQ